MKLWKGIFDKLDRGTMLKDLCGSVVQAIGWPEFEGGLRTEVSLEATECQSEPMLYSRLGDKWSWTLSYQILDPLSSAKTLVCKYS